MHQSFVPSEFYKSTLKPLYYNYHLILTFTSMIAMRNSLILGARLVGLIAVTGLIAASCTTDAPRLSQRPDAANHREPSYSVRISFPAGGERFAVGQTIKVRYTVDPKFQRQHIGNTSYELYLLSRSGLVKGYVGAVEPYVPEFKWTASRLSHWAGTDIISGPLSSGTYRLLLVARGDEGNAFARSQAPNLLIDAYTWFDGHDVFTLDSGRRDVVAGVLAAEGSNIFDIEDSH